MMNRTPVESSNLAAVGYSIEESILEIEFHSGAIYRYFDVPQYEYDGLMAAASHGSYANENIYERYQQERIA